MLQPREQGQIEGGALGAEAPPPSFVGAVAL